MYVYDCLGQYEKVIEQAELCERLDRGDPWPHFMRARASYELFFLEEDSAKLDVLASGVMRSYRSGLELAKNDKRLTALMIVEYFEAASYLWILSNLEEQEVHFIRSLAESLIPEFDLEYSDTPAFYRNELRFAWALIEFWNENYFKALRICSQAFGEVELFETYPWYKMRFHELEAWTFFNMEEMDMYCEALGEIKDHITSGGEYYGQIYSVEEIFEAISIYCE